MTGSPNLSADGVLRISVSSNGQVLTEAIQLVSVHIDRAVNTIPSAKLVIADGEMSTQTFPISDSADFAPGAKINISAGYGDSEESIFEGVVVKHAVKITGENYSRLVDGHPGLDLGEIVLGGGETSHAQPRNSEFLG